MVETRDWQQFIDSNIPLTRAMQVSVQQVSDGTIQLAAPLSPNINDKGTAFGGSVVTLATLCGWVEVQRQLNVAGVDGQFDVVIQHGATDYIQPIQSQFRALVQSLDEAELNKFLRTVARRGVGRIKIQIHIVANDQVCATFDGEYVATRT